MKAVGSGIVFHWGGNGEGVGPAMDDLYILCPCLTQAMAGQSVRFQFAKRPVLALGWQYLERAGRLITFLHVAMIPATDGWAVGGPIMTVQARTSQHNLALGWMPGRRSTILEKGLFHWT
jgi:hypothetical protein